MLRSTGRINESEIRDRYIFALTLPACECVCDTDKYSNITASSGKNTRAQIHMETDRVKDPCVVYPHKIRFFFGVAVHLKSAYLIRILTIR